MTGEATSISKKTRALRIAGRVLMALFGVVVLVLVGFNLYIRIAYNSFYEEAQNQFPIPGISEGFIPQDLDYLDESNTWLFSGYMADDSASPIYKRTVDGAESRFFVELPDGSPYTDHGSAITTAGDYAFLAAKGGYLVLAAADVDAAGNGDTVRAIDKVELDFTPAFMNIENDALYAGNFYRAGNYETPDEHHIVTPDGTENPAIMYSYPADAQGRYGFAEQADRVYSIPGLVQGTCQTPEGQIVLSCSYGFATSHLYVYDVALLTPDGTFVADGREVPLYCLDSRSLTNDVSMPPMSEGIENHEGQVYTTNEAASNKYIFGKLYGAGNVYSLDL